MHSVQLDANERDGHLSVILDRVARVEAATGSVLCKSTFVFKLWCGLTFFSFTLTSFSSFLILGFLYIYMPPKRSNSEKSSRKVSSAAAAASSKGKCHGTSLGTLYWCVHSDLLSIPYLHLSPITLCIGLDSHWSSYLSIRIFT